MKSTRLERREVHYSGHVQGVGFRYTTHQLARGFAVTGYIRNLSGGGVELVVEGQETELDRFLREVNERLGQYIRDAKTAVLAASGEFPEFTIRH